MFHSTWMYRARDVRSRNEANQQESTTKRKAASAVQGSMSSGDCINESSGEDSSRVGSQSHDQADRSEISSKRSVAVSSRSENVESNQDVSLREDNPESREAAQRTILENSSHFAVLAVNDISGDPGGETKENGPRDNGRSSNLLSQTEANSHVTISRQQLENSSILEESQDLNNFSVNASDMGNTHWSHSYTGVRQPVSMRASCRSDNAKLSEDLNEVYVPIIGYEMMEQRAKFTVFKLHVQKNAKDSWFIFRRFTDFERLNSQLAYLFPNFRLALPPKKWFGNNFDPMFLEDRQLGLQAFLNNICGHKDIVISDCVREFLCVDDPPGPHDSLEESRALCESLEETVYNLKRDVAERDRKIVTLTEELSNSTRRIESLTMQQMIPNDRVLPVSPNGSDSTDMDRQSCAEADQQDYSPEQEEQPIVPSFSDDKAKPAIETTKVESPPVFTSIPLDQSASDTKDAPIISPSEVIQVT